MRIRKFFALVLVLALVFTFLPAAAAEGSLFFIAVNDAIPVTLTAQPVTSGGIVYVPYTAFDARPGGIASAYNQTEQTFVLFTKDRRLVFDLASGETSDENQNASAQATLTRNGLLYLPLVFCASHFGLKVSMLESQAGYPVLRFTTGSEVYDDSLFIEKAENLIAYRAAQQSTGADSPGGSPQPDAPAQSVPEVVPELSPATVYLVFQNVDDMEENAALLAEHQLRGTFFLTEAEIVAAPALVRALYAAGHVIGLRVEDAEADAASALARANDALDALLSLRVQLALLPEDAAREEISGYTVFYAQQLDRSAEDVLEHPEISHILLCQENAASAFALLLDAQTSFRLLRETTVFS